MLLFMKQFLRRILYITRHLVTGSCLKLGVCTQDPGLSTVPVRWCYDSIRFVAFGDHSAIYPASVHTGGTIFQIFDICVEYKSKEKLMCMPACLPTCLPAWPSLYIPLCPSVTCPVINTGTYANIYLCTGRRHTRSNTANIYLNVM